MPPKRAKKEEEPPVEKKAKVSPPDPDPVSESEDDESDKPPCQYGANCYRKVIHNVVIDLISQSESESSGRVLPSKEESSHLSTKNCTGSACSRSCSSI